MNLLISCDLSIKSHSGLTPYQREYCADIFHIYSASNIDIFNMYSTSNTDIFPYIFCFQYIPS